MAYKKGFTSYEIKATYNGDVKKFVGSVERFVVNGEILAAFKARLIEQGYIINDTTLYLPDNNPKLCGRPCSPSDFQKGGKCDLNGCYN